MKPAVIFLALCCMTGAPLAATPTFAPNEELRAMSRADQADRESEPINWAVVDAHDKARRVRVGDMLAAGQIRTAEDYYHAAMICQHGSNADDLRLAHALATISMTLAPEHPAPKWLVAAAWDRYLMWKKRPQWYGTQYQFSDKTGKSELYAVDEGAVTDEERAAFQVPPLAVSKAGGGKP